MRTHCHGRQVGSSGCSLPSLADFLRQYKAYCDFIEKKFFSLSYEVKISLRFCYETFFFFFFNAFYKDTFKISTKNLQEKFWWFHQMPYTRPQLTYYHTSIFSISFFTALWTQQYLSVCLSVSQYIFSDLFNRCLDSNLLPKLKIKTIPKWNMIKATILEDLQTPTHTHTTIW